MSTLLKSIRQPLGTTLPLSEVKRRVIVDALDKCGGNYLLAAHLLESEEQRSIVWVGCTAISSQGYKRSG